MKEELYEQKIIVVKNQGIEERNQTKIKKITEECYTKLHNSRNTPQSRPKDNLTIK